MKYQRRFAWVLTAVGGVCLGAAVGMSQLQENRPVLTPAPAHSPDDLSTAFREVADRVLPAVVSIQTETRPQQIARRNSGDARPMNPLEERLFEEFFGNNPGMERFFQQIPESRGPRFTPRREGSGSGFIVDSSGIILTNSHVVEGADHVVVKLHDGREVEAESWNYDPRSDVAIVRINVGEDLPSLTMGNSDQMQIGDWVLALGNPFNVGTTVTSGIISATGRGPGINEREEYLQTDAAINPGNSGGPLVNLYGEVIGINTAISTRSGGYQGIGFAIPSRNARWVAEQLIANGEVQRSYLGVVLQEMTADVRENLGIDYGRGALVVEVFDDSPAGRADLQAGDVILNFNGQPINSRDDLVNAVERAAPNRTYDLKLKRFGEHHTVSVRLERMPGDYSPALQRARAQDMTRNERTSEQEEQVARFGMELTSLSPQIAKQIGLDEDAKGVVVKDVRPGGPADDAGLRTGDVIERVGKVQVTSVEDFRDAASKSESDRGVLVRVRRGQSAIFAVLKPTE